MIRPIDMYEGFNATFNVTTECNLRCKYCYELNKEPGYLNVEYAKRFIDILLTQSHKIVKKESWMLNRGFLLDFIGGDALAVPELCDEIIEYFIYTSTMMGHTWASNWRVNIATNGTWFDNEAVRNLMEKYINTMFVGISIDGCPEIHNMNRSNSMDAILKNWDWYKNYCKRQATVVATKATCNKDSIPYLFKSIKFMFETMGIAQINMNFVFENLELAYKDYEEIEEQFSQIIDYVFDHRDEMYLSMFSPLRIGTPMDQPDKGYCGSGFMPTLGLDGNIYACFRYLPLSTDMKYRPLIIGDVKNGIYDDNKDLQYVQDAIRINISEQKCLDCPIETMCCWCPGGCYSEYGEIRRQTHICKIHQLQDKWARVYWNRYNEAQGISTRYPEVDYSNCVMGNDVYDLRKVKP